MQLDEKRLTRYKGKLELLRERKSDIEDWLQGMTFEFFQSDKKTTLAVYKAFQEAVESAMDICSMLLKDSKKTVKDDYENIKKLEEMKTIPPELAASLTEANGLRNRLVHEYNGLETKTAFESLKELLPRLGDFGREVEKWLEKQK